MLFADGEHIHMIAWREHRVLYWVINTLLEELSNQQMLDDRATPLSRCGKGRRAGAR